MFSRYALSFLLLLLAVGCWATPRQEAATSQADNTRVNKIDRDQAQPTADQQKENRSDRETAAQIRKSIVGDKSLSSYAHNVKVIAQNGTVTLKGPVRSEEEKQNIAKKAADVAGEQNVKNEIEVTDHSGSNNKKQSAAHPSDSQ
jgi:hyperosmotically inducible periplasmic protein